MWPAVWLLLASLVSTGQTPLTVSAAVSLTDALTEIGNAFQAAGNPPVRFNFASSNALARQIGNGAPVDVFISADAAQMDVVERAGRIDPATRSDVIANRLVVLVRAGAVVPVRTVQDLTRAEVRRIAIGNPDAVPAGVYAREWLRASGIWDAIHKKIVPVGSVRAALAAVENGSVDAAIVYVSDTAQMRAAAVAFVVTSGAPRIVYPAAVLNRTRRRADALRFLAFLGGDTAKTIFIRHRFPGEFR
jgi:molybdate transport system substrate-binding protein